ncbi:MAG TPA: nucleoside hydrolase [Chloroflexota bacterium]|nr:nucleoside hydrolase [Chloroflexota bacterium]
MTVPTLSESRRLALLEPPAHHVRMVLDTDTYNEIDDQFALSYVLLSPRRLTLEAVYAAPFHNDRSTGPADGMQKSYEEIQRVLDRVGPAQRPPVFTGSTGWLSGSDGPVSSPAADDLINRALQERDDLLYVVAIGAPTNVASAILAAPEIITRIVVVWLGGQPSTWPTAREFNLRQDLTASRLLFDSGVPLVVVPCINVAEHLRTTQAEIQRFLQGKSAIADYLCEVYSAYLEDHFARSRSLWDVAPVAWLVNPGWVDTVLVHSPILTEQYTWSHDRHRHLVREAVAVDRDAIFGDLFRKLAAGG